MVPRYCNSYIQYGTYGTSPTQPIPGGGGGGGRGGPGGGGGAPEEGVALATPPAGFHTSPVVWCSFT